MDAPHDVPDTTPDVALAQRPRRRWIVVGSVALLLALDSLRPPRSQLVAGLLVAAIDRYQETVSPLLPGLGVRCRFTPTCSQYSEVCLRRHGLFQGVWLSLRRVARCGPWTASQTVDPPPGLTSPLKPSEAVEDP